MSPWTNKALLLGAALALAACGNGEGTKRDDGGSGQPLPPGPPPGETRDNVTGLPLVIAAEEGVLSERGAFVVRYDWLSGPSIDGNDLDLVFADAGRHEPQHVVDVAVKTWMPTMGHGGGRNHLIAQDPQKLNVFHVTSLMLIMGGHWEVFVTATVNGIQDRAVLALDL